MNDNVLRTLLCEVRGISIYLRFSMTCSFASGFTPMDRQLEHWNSDVMNTTSLGQCDSNVQEKEEQRGDQNGRPSVLHFHDGPHLQVSLLNATTGIILPITKMPLARGPNLTAVNTSFVDISISIRQSLCHCLIWKERHSR